LFNHRVVLLWCTKVLPFIELLVDDFNSQSFNVSLSVHHLVRNLLWQNAEAAENGHIFQLLSVFQRSVTHSRVARAARQAVAIKARVCFLLVCDYSILACIVFGI
jgi:hypothetical protein